MKSKEIKLAEIKKHNPTLHSKVMNGEMKLQQERILLYWFQIIKFKPERWCLQNEVFT